MKIILFLLMPFYIFASPLDDEFFMAVFLANQDRITNLLNQGVSIDVKNSYGQTALMNAAFKGNLRLVQFLLNKGANTNIKDKNNWDSLDYAIRQRHNNIIDYFLKNNLVTMENLDFSLDYNNVDAVSKILEKIKQNNSLENVKKEILFKAKSEEALEVLLNYGLPINTQDDRGYTLIHWAVFNKNIQLEKFLFNKGASLDIFNHNGWLAIHTAVYKNSKEMLILLLNQGQRIDVLTATKNTLVNIASDNAMKQLINHIISLKNNDLKEKDIQAAISMGLDVYYKTFNEEALLYRGIKLKNTSLIRIFIKNNPIILKDKEAFMHAVLTEDQDFIEYFIMQGFSLTFKDATGIALKNRVKSDRLKEFLSDLEYYYEE